MMMIFNKTFIRLSEISFISVTVLENDSMSMKIVLENY